MYNMEEDRTQAEPLRCSSSYLVTCVFFNTIIKNAAVVSFSVMLSWDTLQKFFHLSGSVTQITSRWESVIERETEREREKWTVMDGKSLTVTETKKQQKTKTKTKTWHMYHSLPVQRPQRQHIHIRHCFPFKTLDNYVSIYLSFYQSIASIDVYRRWSDHQLIKKIVFEYIHHVDDVDMFIHPLRHFNFSHCIYRDGLRKTLTYFHIPHIRYNIVLSQRDALRRRPSFAAVAFSIHSVTSLATHIFAVDIFHNSVS